MRVILLVSMTAASLACASFQARAAEQPSGGAYAAVESHDAGACMRLCAEDSLCMAWAFRNAGVCELRATAPLDLGWEGAASGLSARVPASMRGVRASEPAAPTAAIETGEKSAPQPSPLARNDPAEALLGGAEAAARDLRPRLGGQR
jgi:hypothetical protein